MTVVPAIQVVQPGFVVVTVAAVQVGIPGDEVSVLGRSRNVRDRRLPPGVIDVTHEKGASASAVDPGDVPLEVLPVEVQIASADAHPRRGARCVIIIPDVCRAGLLELDEAPFQGVLRRYTVKELSICRSFEMPCFFLENKSCYYQIKNLPYTSYTPPKHLLMED